MLLIQVSTFLTGAFATLALVEAFNWASIQPAFERAQGELLRKRVAELF